MKKLLGILLIISMTTSVFSEELDFEYWKKLAEQGDASAQYIETQFPEL